MDEEKNTEQPGNDIDNTDMLKHDIHTRNDDIKRDGDRAGTATMAAARTRTGFLLAVGWILAIASLFIFPYFLFGLAGVIMGVLATKGGSKGGVAVIVANILMMAVGLVFGGVILNYLTRFLGI